MGWSMQIRAFGFSLSILLAGTLAAFASGGRAHANHVCAPPRGPGDSAVHSKDLRVENITCSVGRRVALACVRFTYGQSGRCSAIGYRWRCTSTKPAGSASAQRCVAGRKSMRIIWTD